jgi:hypothetical protein
MDRPDILREYLYGELSGESRDSLEDQIFADEEFAAELDDYENTLIDAFVRGEMNAEQTQRFQERYITSESRRARVTLAKSINEASLVGPTIVSGASEPQTAGWLEGIRAFFGNRGLVYAGAAAAVVLVTSGLWFLATLPGDKVVYDVPKNSANEIVPSIPVEATNHLPPEPSSNNAGETGNGKKANVNNDARRDGTNHAVSPRTFAFTLLPPIRSSGRPVVEIPKGTDTVRITIVHDNKKPYTKYKAEIKDNIGTIVLRREIDLVPKTVERPVSISVQGDRLKAGPYEVTLIGSTRQGDDEEIGFYGFSVKEK